MSAERFLLYQSVVKYASGADPVTVPIEGEPKLSMLVEGAFRGLYLLGPDSDDSGSLIGAFDVIEVSRINHWGAPLLRVGTRDAKLFPQVLALLCDVADLVQLDGRSLAAAISESASRWKTLLAPTSVLSDAAQRGLMGELWVLERLIGARGPMGLDAWNGPLGELHDFSIGGCAIEVKTTLARERIHAISDLRQLQPCEGGDLYVLSLQLQPAGLTASGTLPLAVDAIRASLRRDASRLARLDELLRMVGYHEHHRDRYEASYRLRTKPALVRVNEAFPALTPAVLSRALDPAVATRILDVDYEVSLEQLGVEDGSQEFLDLLPWVPSRVLP